MEFYLDDDEAWTEFLEQHISQSEEGGEDMEAIMERVAEWGEEREAAEEKAAKEAKASTAEVPVALPKATAAATPAEKKKEVVGREAKKPDVFANFKFDLSGLAAPVASAAPAVSAPSAPQPAATPVTFTLPVRSATSKPGTFLSHSKTRKEFEEKDKEYYQQTLEAQQEADAANKKAANAEARERQLKKEIADLQQSQDFLTEQIRKLQQKEAVDAKDRETQAAAKAELEERYKVATDEVASLYTELKKSEEQRHKAENIADEKEAFLAALAQELKDAEVAKEEQKVKAEEGSEAIDQLYALNQQFESIFEDLGSNLTIEDYIKHIRELQASTVHRPRRDSQASFSSVRNALPTRPAVKQRQVSIADELLQASEQPEDAVSDHSPLIEVATTEGNGAEPAKQTKAQPSLPTGSPTRRVRQQNHRLPTISHDAPEEPVDPQSTAKRAVSTATVGTQTKVAVQPPTIVNNTTCQHTHNHPTRVYMKTHQAYPPLWSVVLVLLLTMFYMYITKEAREWRWANDVTRQGQAGMYYGSEPINPFQLKLENWVGIKRSMLG